MGYRAWGLGSLRVWGLSAEILSLWASSLFV